MKIGHLALLLGCLLIATRGPAGAAGADATGLAGTWNGTVTHDDRSEVVALDLDAGPGDTLTVRFSMPVVHLDHVPFGRYPAVAEGDSIRIGPFRFARAGDVLSGPLPAGLAPHYAIPMRLERGAAYAMPERPALRAASREPAWTFDAGSPLWAGPAFADGVVYAGAEDGRLFALDADSGALRWTFEAGGAIRTRPTESGGVLYFQADDGHLYAIDTVTGLPRWRVRLVGSPIERLPFSDPRSRYDRFGSDVTVADGRLYVGTHDGRVLALAAVDGKTLWSYATGDAVLAAPAVHDGRVCFGSYDGFVYALDADEGRLLWKRDTHGAVVSTPEPAAGRMIVGNRAYDLLAIDAASGQVAWKRYVWMSWIESSAVARDGVVYVGSSDAAAVFALDAASGAPVWTRDVHGWSWGRPAVTATRVYVGTSGQAGYPVPHDGAVLALDRVTGAPLWRWAVAEPDAGAFGFPGSPAVGAGRVFAGGLDGRLYAFAE